jgi:TrmH RNA methyltransferase
MVQRPRPHRPQPGPRPSPSDDTSDAIQGLRAGLAVFETRRDDILRVAFSRAVRHEVGALARWAQSRNVPIEEKGDAELDRLAGSSHHEGLLVAARPRRWLSGTELAELLLRTRGTCIALDRVRNPYNVGAVLRSAAFFGMTAALLGAPAPHPGLAPTAVRVAEGGVELVPLARTTDLADTLGRLRARGVRIVGTDGHATQNAIGFAFALPAVVVIGNEREGLGDRVRAQCDAIVGVQGTGRVDSLNVGVAAGVLIAEMTRQRPT